MAKVSKRGGFSDRNGLKSLNTEIQLREIDQRTRIQLQNMISKFYKYVYEDDLYYGGEDIQEFLRFVLDSIYSEPIDTRKMYGDDQIIKMIKMTILNDDYDDVLTVIEALIQFWDQYLRNTKGYRYYDEYNKEYVSKSIYEIANEYFLREYLGYRFVDGIIVPISDTYEVNSVKEALNTKHKPVYEHLSKANKLISDRNNPDYENSIKESISAVEAMCEIITGIKGKEATLGKMLKKIEDDGIQIHSGLKSAFNVLYGYTSDANGIRHAGDIGGRTSTFEEAKFMLVSCSAFINYLIALSAN
ncbi:AbiJ-NTD4 domain-containing protein [Frisingicoccus sp.]|uniref:AbiJ-NTD4 domain-containing protein n=1 Tax=Frisingicoccus sp. TaxID=1918627 RepID=UPI003AB7DA00